MYLNFGWPSACGLTVKTFNIHGLLCSGNTILHTRNGSKKAKKMDDVRLELGWISMWIGDRDEPVEFTSRPHPSGNAELIAQLASLLRMRATLEGR
jgi:hypothetical protein